MGLLANTVARGLKRLETLAGGESCIINGVTMPCLASSAHHGITIDIGGLPTPIGLTLFVRTALLLTADTTLVTADDDTITADSDTGIPVSGRKLTFRGETLRILTVKRAAGGSHVELMLADPDSAG